MTEQLARQLIDEFNEQNPYVGHVPPWLQALNFVYGAMVGHQSEGGENPNRAVNIERLISSLRLLSEKNEREAAPFVASWKPGADGFAMPNYSRGSRGIVKAIEQMVQGGRRSSRSFSDRDLERALDEALFPSPEPGAQSSFEEAEQHLVRGISSVLDRIDTTKYLEPLGDLAKSQDGGLDILTLNYDRTIEEMATAQGLFVERGLPNWEPAKPLNFYSSDASVRLYKLHGSVDWFQERQSSEAKPPRIVEGPVTDSSVRSYRQPWLVVGDREKLSTEGPILALMRAAEDALRNSSHVVVIGYSFSDPHINSMLRNWLSGDESRTLGVIDPAWPAQPTGFRGHLARDFGADGSEWDRSRLLIDRGTTGERLEDALANGANPDYQAGATFGINRSGHDEFEITLAHPAEIDSVRLNVGTPARWDAVKPGSEVALTAITPQMSVMASSGQTTYKTLHYDSWERGNGVRFKAQGPIAEDARVVLIYSRTDATGLRRTILEVPPAGR